MPDECVFCQRIERGEFDYYDRYSTRVYTRTGKYAHLLRPDMSPNLGLPALCGHGAAAWYGTGTQAEHEAAASMPLCKYCMKRAGEADEADSRLAEYGRQERKAEAS